MSVLRSATYELALSVYLMKLRWWSACHVTPTQPNGIFEVALTVTYASQSSPAFVYEPGAFVIGAIHKAPE